MRVAQKFAGYTLAEADNLRKACGKKIRAIIQAEREKFVAGCVATGYERVTGHRAVRHHRALRRLRLQQVPRLRLRVRRLPDGLAEGPLPGRVPGRPAHLGQGRQGQDRRSTWPSAGRSGIEVLVPDVNRSLAEFTADFSDGQGAVGAQGDQPGAITFGLAAVRNVGEGLVDRIVAEREAGRAVRRLLRLLPAGRPQVLNKRTVESLIKAGAFDSLGHPRQGLCLVFEEIVDRTLERRREHDAGVVSLFASLETETEGQTTGFGDTRIPIPDTEFDKSQRLAFEKEMLGLYISDHPLMGMEGSLARLTDCTLAELRDADPDPTGGGAGAVRGRGPGPAGRRGGHRAEAPLHQEGRPDGHLRPGGPQRLDRGVRVPQVHGRLRRPPGRRRHRGPEGPGRPPGRPPEAGVHGGPTARAGRRRLHRPADLAAAQQPHRHQGRRPEAPPAGASRATRPSSSTWARRCCASPPSSTWTAGGGWSASSGCCSDPTPSSADRSRAGWRP